MPLHAMNYCNSPYITLRHHLRLLTYAWSPNHHQDVTFMHLTSTRSSDLSILVFGVAQITRECQKAKKGLHNKTLAKYNESVTPDSWYAFNFRNLYIFAGTRRVGGPTRQVES